MKLSDIKEGEYYTYQTYKYATKKKALVLEIGVPIEHYNYPGARIEVVDSGRIISVPARKLGPLWAATEEEEKRLGELRERKLQKAKELSVIMDKLEVALKSVNPDIWIELYEWTEPKLIIHLYIEEARSLLDRITSS